MSRWCSYLLTVACHGDRKERSVAITDDRGHEAIS